MPTKNNKNIILLPIYPKYAAAIMNGDKTVEFRKLNIPRNIDYVLVYSTAPDKQIIGYFKVKEVQEISPKELWSRYNSCGVIKKDPFFNYYKNNSLGRCILIEKIKKFKKPVLLNDIDDNITAPQSFIYIHNDIWNKLKSC